MLKIGILIRDFESLENWELRIIEGIKNDPDLELTLLIMNRSEKRDSKSIKKSFGEYLFNKQIQIEKKRYLNNLQDVNKELILDFLNTIPIKELNEKRNDFPRNDSQKIKKYRLDVILKLDCKIVSIEMSLTAKHGVWFLSHSDLSLKRGGFPGFWEVLLKEPVVTVSLIQLSDQKGMGNIIDKAHYNLKPDSSVKTNNVIKESSVSFLIKNLKRLSKEGIVQTKDKMNLSNFDLALNIKPVLLYYFDFYGDYINRKTKSILESSEKRNQQWTLFIGQGKFMDADLSKLNPVKVQNDEFWADPFLFQYQNEYFVFFEKYSYKTKKGIISCGKVKDNQLVDVIDVLEKDYHLSYPFIFKEDGEIFMMPETGENKRLEIYKCINFPNKWVLYSTAFEGEAVQDTTLYIDVQKQKWLFLNKVVAPNVDRTSELYIYKIDSLRLKKIEPHKQNPVLIDSRVARNGGGIFMYKGKTYRPSQSNTDGVYGKALNINQIKKMTIGEYKEKVIRKVEPNFKKNLLSIHHLHQIDKMFVFDAAYDRL